MFVCVFLPVARLSLTFGSSGPCWLPIAPVQPETALYTPTLTPNPFQLHSPRSHSTPVDMGSRVSVSQLWKKGQSTREVSKPSVRQQARYTRSQVSLLVWLTHRGPWFTWFKHLPGKSITKKDTYGCAQRINGPAQCMQLLQPYSRILDPPTPDFCLLNSILREGFYSSRPDQNFLHLLKNMFVIFPCCLQKRIHRYWGNIFYIFFPGAKDPQIWKARKAAGCGRPFSQRPQAAAAFRRRRSRRRPFRRRSGRGEGAKRRRCLRSARVLRRILPFGRLGLENFFRPRFFGSFPS